MNFCKSKNELMSKTFWRKVGMVLGRWFRFATCLALNHVFHILGEVGWLAEETIEDPSSIHLTICGDTGEYAWKAVMIHKVLVERGFAHWQDAGCRFKTTASLTETLDYTAEHGFASRGSGGAIWDWTFPAQIQFLRAASIDTSTGNCDASSIGFTLERCRFLHPCHCIIVSNILKATTFLNNMV